MDFIFLVFLIYFYLEKNCFAMLYGMVFKHLVYR